MKLWYISYDYPKIPVVSHILQVVIALFLHQGCIRSVSSYTFLLLKWESTHILLTNKKLLFFFSFGGGCFGLVFPFSPAYTSSKKKKNLVLISTLTDKIMQHLGKPTIKMNTSKPTQINLACHNAHTSTPNLGVRFFCIK